MNYLLEIRKLLFISIVTLLTNQVINAQTTPFVEYTGKRELTIRAEKEEILELSFRIRDNYHIQADRLNNDYLIPTTLSLIGPENLAIGKVLFPSPKKFSMKGAAEPWDVFSDKLTVYVPVNVVKPMMEGNFKMLLNGSLFYQACDTMKCYFPRNLDFLVIVEVEF